VQIPSDRRIALLGPSDKDNQILIDILAGGLMPTAGRVIRKAAVSFPVGRLPGLSSDLTVRVNVAHVARLYGADVRQLLNFVERVLGIGQAFDKPYSEMPSSMRRPLAQVVALGLPFDTYLLADDSLSRGKASRRGRKNDSSSRQKDIFEARWQTAGMIVPTQDLEFARGHCELGLLLREGRLKLIEDLEAFAARFGRRQRMKKKRRGEDLAAE
jgi:capsular polysaccharide transport system ATP-binding protein